MNHLSPEIWTMPKSNVWVGHKMASAARSQSRSGGVGVETWSPCAGVQHSVQCTVHRTGFVPSRSCLQTEEGSPAPGLGPTGGLALALRVSGDTGEQSEQSSLAMSCLGLSTVGAIINEMRIVLLSLWCINLKNLCAHLQEEILTIPKHPWHAHAKKAMFWDNSRFTYYLELICSIKIIFERTVQL